MLKKLTLSLLAAAALPATAMAQVEVRITGSFLGSKSELSPDQEVPVDGQPDPTDPTTGSDALGIASLKSIPAAPRPGSWSRFPTLSANLRVCICIARRPARTARSPSVSSTWSPLRRITAK